LAREEAPAACGEGALPWTTKIVDWWRAGNSFPPAILRFVTKLKIVVALEWLTTHRCPVPDFMTSVASPMKPNMRRRMGLQRWRHDSLATHAVCRLNELPRRIFAPHDVPCVGSRK
jgi:hypothetical protein